MQQCVHRAGGAFAFLLLGGLVLSDEAPAQTLTDLAGTWVAVTNVSDSGGKRVDVYGANPRGVLMIDTNGRYVIALARAGLPKVASNNRTTATAEESKAIVEGSIFHYGTISINAAAKTLVFKIETSTFPNWDGAEQKRAFALAGDQLTYTNPGSGGGTVTAVWKRMK
jgi:hypothetical protein